MPIDWNSSKLTLNKIEFKDRPIFDKAYSGLKRPLADQAFPMIYIWSKVLDMKWTQINNNLSIFAEFEGSPVIWGPVIGGTKLKETLSQCFSILSKLGSEAPKLLYLPEELAQSYSNSDLNVTPQSQEYVYDSKTIAALQGSQFAKKRNMVSNFKSTYYYITEPFSRKHKAGCFDLLKRWKSAKAQSPEIRKVKEQFSMEIRLSEETIKNAEVLGLKGMVIIVDGKIQGMTFGYEVNKDMCSVAVEKTNPQIKGISEFIFSKFVEEYWLGYRYVNAQEDMGVPYLKEAKLSYHPEFLIKSFSVLRDRG